MGFVKRWDAEDIQRQINVCAAQMNSHYNDGFTQWYCKQDLLMLKYQLDEILRSAPTFAPEQQFLDDLNKNTVWKRLNEKTN